MCEQPSLAIVVPFCDRGLDEVQRAASSLIGQLRDCDDLVISVQRFQNDEERDQLIELSCLLGITLVADVQPPGVWSIARARNVGLLAASDHAYVACLDVDCVAPARYVDGALEWLYCHPYDGLAPIVVDTGSQRERPGSGLAFLPMALVRAVNGWEEAFAGYGSEDIDLFYRIEEVEPSFRVRPWWGGPRVSHHSHPRTPERGIFQDANIDLLADRRHLGVVRALEGLSAHPTPVPVLVRRGDRCDP